MDGAVTSETLRQAERFDSELTARQREVLRHIADGKTNGEIAEALGMTLAGAKWHVSELLTKLGLASREEAAAYFRWREAPRRRLSRQLSGLAPVGWWKLGFGALGLASSAVAAIVVIGALRQESPDVGPATPGLPFAMESVYTRRTDHTALEAGRRYWYESPARLRTDFGSPVVTRADSGFEMEFDPGAITILVDQGRRTYSSGSAYSVTSHSDSSGVDSAMTATLGPLPYKSLDEAIINLSGGDRSGSPIETRRVGRARIAGLSVLGVQFVVHKAEPGTFSYTLWIDPERMLLLKRETSYSSGDGSADGAIHEVETATRISYGRVDSSKFVVGPVPGATVINCQAVVQAPNAGFFTEPFVPIPSGALPLGLRTLNWCVVADSNGNCESATASYVYESDPNGPIVLFLSEHATVPNDFFDGTGLRNVGSDEVAIMFDIAGNRYFRFVVNNTAVEFRFATLPEDQVLAMVEAMLRLTR